MPLACSYKYNQLVLSSVKQQPMAFLCLKLTYIHDPLGSSLPVNLQSSASRSAIFSCQFYFLQTYLGAVLISLTIPWPTLLLKPKMKSSTLQDPSQAIFSFIKPMRNLGNASPQRTSLLISCTWFLPSLVASYTPFYLLSLSFGLYLLHSVITNYSQMPRYIDYLSLGSIMFLLGTQGTFLEIMN